MSDKVAELEKEVKKLNKTIKTLRRRLIKFKNRERSIEGELDILDDYTYKTKLVKLTEHIDLCPECGDSMDCIDVCDREMMVCVNKLCLHRRWAV